MAGKHQQPPERPRSADSGDESGQGRERRDADEVFPQQRNAGDFGTHGGPSRHGKGERKDSGQGR